MVNQSINDWSIDGNSLKWFGKEWQSLRNCILECTLSISCRSHWIMVRRKCYMYYMNAIYYHFIGCVKICALLVRKIFKILHRSFQSHSNHHQNLTTNEERALETLKKSSMDRRRTPSGLQPDIKLNNVYKGF